MFRLVNWGSPHSRANHIHKKLKYSFTSVHRPLHKTKAMFYFCAWLKNPQRDPIGISSTRQLRPRRVFSPRIRRMLRGIQLNSWGTISSEAEYCGSCVGSIGSFIFPRESTKTWFALGCGPNKPVCCPTKQRLPCMDYLMCLRRRFICRFPWPGENGGFGYPKECSSTMEMCRHKNELGQVRCR